MRREDENPVKFEEVAEDNLQDDLDVDDFELSDISDVVHEENLDESTLDETFN